MPDRRARLLTRYAHHHHLPQYIAVNVGGPCPFTLRVAKATLWHPANLPTAQRPAAQRLFAKITGMMAVTQLARHLGDDHLLPVSTYREWDEARPTAHLVAWFEHAGVYEGVYASEDRTICVAMSQLRAPSPRTG